MEGLAAPIMNADILILKNPLTDSFSFTWDSIPYTVPPKGTVTLPGHVARHGAKKLAHHTLQQAQGIAALKNEKLVASEMSQFITVFEQATTPQLEEGAVEEDELELEEFPQLEEEEVEEDELEVLEGYTVAQLKDMADERDLEYPTNIKKADLIDLLAE